MIDKRSEVSNVTVRFSQRSYLHASVFKTRVPVSNFEWILKLWSTSNLFLNHQSMIDLFNRHEYVTNYPHTVENVFRTKGCYYQLTHYSPRDSSRLELLLRADDGDSILWRLFKRLK